MGQKCAGNCGLWVRNEIVKKSYPEKKKKKSWVPFGSYLLNSTANPAHFQSNFIKNPQTTIALTFLAHIISGIDGVGWDIQISAQDSVFFRAASNFLTKSYLQIKHQIDNSEL